MIFHCHQNTPSKLHFSSFTKYMFFMVFIMSIFVILLFHVQSISNSIINTLDGVHKSYGFPMCSNIICGCHLRAKVGVVVIQEYDKLQENFVYYLSYALDGLKLWYSHIEKLALAVVYAVQRLHHYILLRTTTVVVDFNPFQYVFSWCIIGGKFNKWIVILQEFDLDF